MDRRSEKNRQQTDHRLLRGGRFVKWQGRVASIAPSIGGFAATLVLAALSVGEASAAPCTVSPNGTVELSAARNTNGCELSSIGSEIGNTHT